MRSISLQLYLDNQGFMDKLDHFLLSGFLNIKI